VPFHAPPMSALFPYTTLFRSLLTCSPLAADSATQTIGDSGGTIYVGPHTLTIPPGALNDTVTITAVAPADTVNRVQFQPQGLTRSEEHTSELQSRSDLVCRLL